MQAGLKEPNTTPRDIVEPKGNEPKPMQYSTAVEEMDATTAMKFIWLYGDLNGNILKPRSEADKDLYAKALAHPQADELRTALAHRISMHAVPASAAAVAQKNEGSVFGKEANEVASYIDDPASNDAIAGVVGAVGEPERDGRSHLLIWDDNGVTDQAAVACTTDGIVGEVATELSNNIACTNRDGPADIDQSSATTEFFARSRRNLLKEWDHLALNEIDVFDNIERDNHALVSRDGEVSFAKPDEVSRAHRLCLQVFQTRAKHLFGEQEYKFEAQKMSAAKVAQRGG